MHFSTVEFKTFNSFVSFRGVNNFSTAQFINWTLLWGRYLSIHGGQETYFSGLYVTSVSVIYLEALLTSKSHDRTKQNETKRANKQKHTQSIEHLAKTVGQRN